MDLDTILMIVSAVLAIGATVFGAKFEAVKKKLTQGKELVKEGNRNDTNWRKNCIRK